MSPARAGAGWDFQVLQAWLVRMELTTIEEVWGAMCGSRGFDRRVTVLTEARAAADCRRFREFRPK